MPLLRKLTQLLPPRLPMLCPSPLNRCLSSARSIIAAIALISVSIAAKDSGGITPHVVGGDPAPANAYPWMVALFDSNDGLSNRDRFFCGGVLIDPYWVLTAAHCVDGLWPHEFDVAHGDRDLDDISTTNEIVFISTHPEYYNRTARGADLALVRLARPITDIEPLRLNFDAAYAASLSEARIIGWGSTQFDYQFRDIPNRLQEADVTLYTREHANQPDIFNGYIIPDFLVAGNESPLRGTFSGDSGGPLLIRDPQGSWIGAGITSWGVGGCGGPYEHFSMFTDIAIFENWLRSMVFDRRWQPEEAFLERGLSSDTFVTNDPDTGEETIYFQVWPFSNDYWEEYTIGRVPLNSRGEVGWEYINQSDFEDSLSYRDEKWYFKMPRETLVNDMFHQRFFNQRYAPKVTGADVVISSLGPVGTIVTGMPYNSGGGALFCVLDSLRPGQSYLAGGSNVVSWRRNGLSNIERHEVSFVAEADRVYAIASMDEFPRNQRISIQSGSTQVIGPSGGLSRELSAESHQHRRPGYHYESFQLEDWFSSDEAIITIDSDFDAEISLNHRLNGEQLAYHDQEVANITETLIVDGESINQSNIRIFNFDANVYGSFTLNVETHVSSNFARYGRATRRAITGSDREFKHDDGIIQYYEEIALPSLPSDETVVIRVRGYNQVEPAIALFEREFGGALIGSANYDRCADYSEIRFRPQSGQLYELVVAVFGESNKNANYELIVAEETSYLLNEQPQATNAKALRNRYRIHNRQIDRLEIEAKLIESRYAGGSESHSRHR